MSSVEFNGLQFTLTVPSLSHGEFLVTAFDYQEQLSNLYQVDLSLASSRYDIAPDEVVDQGATLTIWQDGVIQRQVHGIVSRFSQGDTGHHHTFYKITLAPSATRLQLRQNSRIFQQQDALSIISILLQEMGITDYAFACQRSVPKREYCVQYRETDLAFISRLAAEEGLFYFFEHHESRHVMVFCDHNQGTSELSNPLLYHHLAGGQRAQTCIFNFAQQQRVSPAQVQLKDYSFKQPSHDFLANGPALTPPWQRGDYEHYDFPGRYKDSAIGAHYSKVTELALRRHADTAQGQSDIPQLVCGVRFNLAEHPNGALNMPWLLVSVRHQGTQPQALAQAAGEGKTHYQNQFSVVPAKLEWKSERVIRPVVDGPQMATVTGPQGEEIFCDEHGRVKVQFPWDRYSNSDDNASCWIRVSQDWAGAQYGHMAIPRIGHEVIVSFLEGDPDQPIITGRTFHATHKPPYPLPANKTRTVLRTKTHKGEGYNELRFEDEAGQEEIYIHAQKDQNRQVENDWGEQIKRDEHSQADQHSFTLIKGNEHATTEGETRHLIKGDQTWLMDSKLHTKVGQKWLSEVGQEVHQQAGNKVVLDAGVEITLSAGGSFIKLDPAGVHLVGPAINFNAGGSAGSGSGYAGLVAELVKGVEQASNNATPTTMPVKAFKDMAKAAVVIQEECDCSGVDTCPIHKKLK